MGTACHIIPTREGEFAKTGHRARADARCASLLECDCWNIPKRDPAMWCHSRKFRRCFLGPQVVAPAPERAHRGHYRSGRPKVSLMRHTTVWCHNSRSATTWSALVSEWAVWGATYRIGRIRPRSARTYRQRPCRRGHHLPSGSAGSASCMPSDRSDVDLFAVGL